MTLTSNTCSISNIGQVLDDDKSAEIKEKILPQPIFVQHARTEGVNISLKVVISMYKVGTPDFAIKMG